MKSQTRSLEETIPQAARATPVRTRRVMSFITHPFKAEGSTSISGRALVSVHDEAPPLTMSRRAREYIPSRRPTKDVLVVWTSPPLMMRRASDYIIASSENIPKTFATAVPTRSH